MRYLCITLATLVFSVLSSAILADDRASCGNSTYCSKNVNLPPFLLRNKPFPSEMRLARLPVMLNTHNSQNIVEIPFSTETQTALLLLAERWLQQHSDLPLLLAPQLHNQHYPGLKLNHNSEIQRNHFMAWGTTPTFSNAMAGHFQQQGADALLLLFIGRNTLLPQGQLPPYLTQGSWQGRGERAKLGTYFFEFLAYQAVVINQQGEVIAAATEGFQVGTSVYDDGIVLSSFTDNERRIWYQLNERDVRQSIEQCEHNATCPAHQAMAQLFANLNLNQRAAR